MRKKKSFIILAIAVILMPFIENLMGLREMVTATAATMSETLVMKDSGGHVEVTQTYMEEGDQVIWRLNYKRDQATVASRLKFDIDTESKTNGAQISGEGFTMTDGWLSENDFGTHNGTVSIVAPAGQNIHLSVDLDKQMAAAPVAVAADGVTVADEGEGDAEDGEGPRLELVENVLTESGENGPYLLEVPEATGEVDEAGEVASEEGEKGPAVIEENENVANNTIETAPETDLELKSESEIESEDNEEIAGPVMGSSQVFSADYSDNDATIFQRSDVSGGPAQLFEVEQLDKKAEIYDWDKRQYKISIDAKVQGEIRESGADVVMVMDVSGSMEGTNLTRLKKTAKNFLGQLAGVTYDQKGNPIKQGGKIVTKSTISNVAMISYASSAKALSGGDTVSANFTNISGAIDSLFATVNGLEAGGATRADLGMKMAYHSIKNRKTNNPLYVIFLSDGVPTTSSSYDNKVATEAQSWSSLIQNRLATAYDWSITNVTRAREVCNSKNEWTVNTPAKAHNPSEKEQKEILVYLDKNHGDEEEVSNGELTGKDFYSGGKRYRYVYTFSAKRAVDYQYGWVDETMGSNEVRIKVTKETPVIQATPAPKVYAIEQASKWPDYSEKFMTGIASASSNVFLSDNQAQMNKIFSDIADEIQDGGVVDVIDEHFVLAAGEKERLEKLGVTVTTDEQGRVRLVWPINKDTAMINVDSSENGNGWFIIEAKQDFAGANVVPTNVPDSSGVYSEGSRVEGFDIGNDQLETPYVNVRLKPLLKDAITAEGPRKADDTFNTYEEIMDAWYTEVVPVAKGDVTGDVPYGYDETLGAYPEINIEDFEGYDATPNDSRLYESVASATAENYTDDVEALAYANNVARGNDTEAPGHSEDNRVSARVTHRVIFEGEPVISKRGKKAVMTDWEERLYRIDIEAQVEQEVEGITNPSEHTVKVIETLDKRFELTDNGLGNVVTFGGIVSVDDTGVTTITWENLKINTEWTYKFSFEVKAKEGYIGENAVPTSIYNKSGIQIDKLPIRPFEITNGAGLATPYVNVRLLPFEMEISQEQGLLGSAAWDEAKIGKAWTNTDNYSFVGHDYTIGEAPKISVPAEITGYNEKIVGAKTYTETAVARAATSQHGENPVTQRAVRNEKVTPSSYADAARVSELGEAGLAASNYRVADAVHEIEITTMELSLEKFLEGKQLPTDENFSYEASFNVTSPEEFNDVDAQAKINFEMKSDGWWLQLDTLGIGQYTIKENVPSGVKEAEEWLLDITDYTDEGEVVYTLSQGEKTELTHLDNYWNDFILKVSKLNNSGEALVGAQFTLTKTEEDSFDPIVLGADEEISEFEFSGLRPGIYELAETYTPDNYLSLEKAVTIEITDFGQVIVDGTDISYEATENGNEIYLDITNIATGGILPETGGQGTLHFVVASMAFMVLASVAAAFYVRASKKGGI